MIRFAFLALLALAVTAVPMGEASVAHAQKKRKTVKKKKKAKAVKRTKKAVKKTRATKAKAKKAAVKKGAVKIKVKAALRNTNKVIAKAKGAVQIGTKGKADLRAAAVRQHAARVALAKGKRKQAFYLTRLARGLAWGVIGANGMKAEKEKEAVLDDPTAGEMEEIGGYIAEVEEAKKVPAEDQILDDATLGVDQPEDLGEDETEELEKEVIMEKESE